VDNKSRAYEERHFTDTVAFAAGRAERAAAELSALENRLRDMITRYSSENFELYSQIVVAQDMRNGLADLLGRCRRAVSYPYFGRVDFAEDGGEPREFYIGRNSLYDDKTRDIIVVDWRTPLANLYYEADLGTASYLSLGRTYTGNMSLKRTYSIADGKFNDYYDSDLVTNDELLQAYLAKNADAVLRDIVSTIQKDQNGIIRIEPSCNVIVQGVAGSGKTTVAMHRLAYLIFNYAQQITPDQYAVIGTNRMFLRYISGMLPDLGVESVTQMVMPELLEDFLEYEPAAVLLDRNTAPERSSPAFFEDLRAYIDRLEQDTLLHPITLGGEILISEGKLRDRFIDGLKRPLLYRAELLNEYLVSQIQWKRPALEQALEKRCDSAVARFKRGDKGRYLSVGEIIDEKYTSLKRLDDEVKALKNIYLKQVRGIKEGRVYTDFLKTRGLKKPKHWDVYDLAALAYIASRLRPMRSKLRHIIIDEAQDFGPMLYQCLTAIFPDATFTILGDVLQNIGEGVGITDWDEVLGSAFAERATRFRVLSKSYRNTVEIAETASRVTARSGVAKYEVVPVVRHGKQVEFSAFSSRLELEDAAVHEAEEWKKGSLALVCPDTAGAKKLAARLPGAGLIVADDGNDRYEGGVTVFDAGSVKGLEFDRVVVCGAGAKDYPDTPLTARLLYIVLTRALHELRVLTVDGSGGLLEITSPPS
jgi:DNA helicase-2/ATP-dependent DNA helicase PcrA